MEKITEPYRHLTLKNGQHGVVFECFTHGGVGKISSLYCGWTTNTYYKIHYDGMPWEFKTERQIGLATELEKYDPPIEFTDKFTIVAYNNSGSDYTFEVIVNGEIYHA
jgi:hypothetical protein